MKNPNALQTVTEIEKLHSEILDAARGTLDKAIKIGELLTGIKAGLKHGEWLPWLQNNLMFSERTARNYCRTFAERDKLKSETISDLTAAYRFLAEPKTESEGLITEKGFREFLRKNGISDKDIVRESGFGDGISDEELYLAFYDYLGSKGITFADDDASSIVKVIVLAKVLLHRESFTPEMIRKLLADYKTAWREKVL